MPQTTATEASTLHIVHCTGRGFFVGTYRATPGFGTHGSDALRLPSRDAAERWVERIRQESPDCRDRAFTVLTVEEARAREDW